MPTYSIPKAIHDAHLALPWDDRGLYWEIRVTPTVAVTNTHIDRGDRGTVAWRSYTGSVNGVPQLKEYSDPAPVDPCISAIPRPGMRVWMIKDRKFSLVETMRVEESTVVGLSKMRQDGPYPGIPSPSDSGSVAWTMVDGKACLVGHANYAGTISTPFWLQRADRPSVGQRDLVEPGGPDSDSDFYFGSERIEVSNKHSVRISSAFAVKPTSATIRGTGSNGGDRWEFPKHPEGYWPIEVRTVSTTDFILEWDVSQTFGRGYTIEVAFTDGTTSRWANVAPGDVLQVLFTEGTPVPTVATPVPTVATPVPTVATPVPTVATPVPTVATPAAPAEGTDLDADLQAAQAEIARLKEELALSETVGAKIAETAHQFVTAFDNLRRISEAWKRTE